MIIRFSIACLALTSGIALGARAEDIDVKKVAKAKAEEVQTALVKGEFEKLVDLTHPKAVELLGGKEKMVAKMTKEIKEMETKGFGFKSVKISDPSDPVQMGKQLYLLVPFSLELKAPNARIITKSSLVGVSEDGGKTWVFVDITPGRDKIKEVLPNLPDSLVFPKAEPPTIIKD
jgi:hypothetical protein